MAAEEEWIEVPRSWLALEARHVAPPPPERTREEYLEKALQEAIAARDRARGWLIIAGFFVVREFVEAWGPWVSGAIAGVLLLVYWWRQRRAGLEG